MPPYVKQLIRVTMLNFANKSVNIQTLLSNATELAKFTPNGPDHNAIEVTEGANVRVYTKDNDDFTDLLKVLTLSDEKYDSFAQEKMILIWHFSQLIPYLQDRLAHIRSMPIDTLRQYHDNSMQFQGFHQLCKNLVLQLDTFNQLINQIENQSKQYWTFQFKLLQQYLSKDLDAVMTCAEQFISQIVEQRKTKLSVMTDELRLHQHGQLILFEAISRPMPRTYPLGTVRVGAQRYEVTAHFQTFRSTWQTPTKFQFTGKLNISLATVDAKVHASLLVHPSWDKEPLCEISQTQLDQAKDCAHNRLMALYLNNPISAITFEPATLRASFVNLCTHVTGNQVLPYCVTLVSFAKSHNINEVTIYAPYNYSAIMYANGFYSLNKDTELPTKADQQSVIANAFASGQVTPILDRSLNRHAGVNNPLLRPFCFSLNNLESIPVYLTEDRVKTTYAELLNSSTLNEEEGYAGIFPEILQIPLKFTGAHNSIREREISGKLKKPAVTFQMEQVNYQALDKDNELQNYALTDTQASLLSQNQKMLILKKKML